MISHAFRTETAEQNERAIAVIQKLGAVCLLREADRSRLEAVLIGDREKASLYRHSGLVRLCQRMNLRVHIAEAILGASNGLKPSDLFSELHELFGDGLDPQMFLDEWADIHVRFRVSPFDA